jgi:hypothetical protein
MNIPPSIEPPGKWEIDGKEVTIYFSVKEYDDGPIAVSREFSSADVVFEHWFKLKPWSFAERTRAKKAATIKDPHSRTTDFDEDKYLEIKVRSCLLDWSISLDNERVKIHRVNGYMTDESWNAINNKVKIAIVDFVFRELDKLVERYA